MLSHHRELICYYVVRNAKRMAPSTSSYLVTDRQVVLHHRRELICSIMLFAMARGWHLGHHHILQHIIIIGTLITKCYILPMYVKVYLG